MQSIYIHTYNVSGRCDSYPCTGQGSNRHTERKTLWRFGDRETCTYL